MKANELMIGDWVCCTDPTPFKIEAITIIDTPEYVTGSDGFDVEIADLQPIPLTKEILEENGFEKKIHYGIFDDYYDFELWEYSDGIWLTTYHNCEVSLPDEQVFISFVNELQHFLTHCGIEKEIEL